MTIDPATAGPQNTYKLLIGAIVPRPIAWVSSVNEQGQRNLAPFSFFTGASADPPVICFCPMIRGNGSTKDTLNNIRATGEFVVNIVSHEIAQKMNLTSGEYGPDVDEFTVAGLTSIPSNLVRAPRVVESKISMECRLWRIVEVSKKPMGGSVVFGEVLRFHIADHLVEDFRIDPDGLDAIARMGGATYSTTRDHFDLERPKV